MSKDVVVFGFSHFLGDIYDCIENEATGDLTLKTIVLNVPETPVAGRATLAQRLARFRRVVDVVRLEDFIPRGERFELYVIGFSGKQMVPLLKLLAGLRFSPLVHVRSILQAGSELADGVIVDAGAIVGPWAMVGRHTILNRGSSVGHDCEIGAYSFLGPSATLCSHVRLGENVKVGANATVLPDLRIGSDAVIGAGAVVTKDVPAGAMVMGVPAVGREL